MNAPADPQFASRIRASFQRQKAMALIGASLTLVEPGRDARPQLERFLAVLEDHKASLLQQREDIEAQLSEIQTFEKKVRKQLKRS